MTLDPLSLAYMNEGDGFSETHSASDAGGFCSVSDDEVSIVVHSHQNARRIGEWLIEWADAKELRDAERAGGSDE
jgi:hypothetical protein